MLRRASIIASQVNVVMCFCRELPLVGVWLSPFSVCLAESVVECARRGQLVAWSDQQPKACFEKTAKKSIEKKNNNI